MLPEQEERLVVALESLALALTKSYRLEQLRFEKEFPPKKARLCAQINRADDAKREQYSDRADAEWLERTTDALPESRFQKRLEETKKTSGA